MFVPSIVLGRVSSRRVDAFSVCTRVCGALRAAVNPVGPFTGLVTVGDACRRRFQPHGSLLSVHRWCSPRTVSVQGSRHGMHPGSRHGSLAGCACRCALRCTPRFTERCASRSTPDTNHQHTLVDQTTPGSRHTPPAAATPQPTPTLKVPDHTPPAAAPQPATMPPTPSRLVKARRRRHKHWYKQTPSHPTKPTLTHHKTRHKPHTQQARTARGSETRHGKTGTEKHTRLRRRCPERRTSHGW